MAIVAALGAWAVRAQNLDEGKTAPQLFEADCSACHKSPAGLAKKNTGGSLAGFLRQHYTSSAQSASLLAAYLAAAPSNPRAERAERKKGGRGEDNASAADEKETKGQRKTREKTAVARPPEEKTGADRRKERKSKRFGVPEPTVSQPPAAPAGQAQPTAPTPGEGQTATAPPPPTPSGEPAPAAPPVPSDTPAAAAPPPAATPSPPPSRVADQPVFSTPLP